MQRSRSPSRLGAAIATAAPLAAFAACFMACSASSDTSTFTGTAAGTGTGTGSGGGAASSSAGLFDGGTGSTGSGGGDGCSEQAKLVYVIGTNNELFSFYPPTLELTQVGTIACPSNGATPFSMAVDRRGIAWILHNDGRIFHVDTTDASCTATAYQPGQLGLTLFGMGFVSDAAGSEEETLHIADYNGSGLATIDTETLQTSWVGAWDDLFGGAELTGTGDARLFGFFNQEPVVIAEIEKTNAAILSQAAQPSVEIGSGWAFAFWGGDFWLFTAPFGDSQIDHYRPGVGTQIVKQNLGAVIVGAGVSTCAPVIPPD